MSSNVKMRERSGQYDNEQYLGREQLRLGFLIHDVSRLRKTLFDQRLKELGITRSQWWVLANLSRHGDEPISQVDLARLMDMKKVTLGGLLDRMEAAEFVSRERSPTDRRINYVKVSKKGMKTLAVIQSIGIPVNDEITKGISSKDLAIATKVIQRMKSNIIEMIDTD